MPLSPYALQLAEATGHPMASSSRAAAELASAVAEELEFDEARRHELEIAALVHDLGKLSLMDEILYKSGGLTEQELALIRQHPLRGQEMLERIGEGFHGVARIVRACYERWDGDGYPDGLAGEEIPMASRIIFCCVAYEAMTSDRPYSEAMSHTAAVSELWAGSGSQFDPEVVSALVRTVARTRPARSTDAERAASTTTPRLRRVVDGAG